MSKKATPMRVLKLKAIYVLLGLTFTAVCLSVYYLLGTGILDKSLYQNFRAAFFTGFLTVGSFVLTMKTLILTKVVEFYTDDEYLKILGEITESSGIKPNNMRQVENIRKLMSLAIILAYTTSLSQMSLGLTCLDWAIAICYAMAVVTLLAVFFVWLVSNYNLSVWIASRKK